MLHHIGIPVRRVWVVYGPSGAGKSSVGRYLGSVESLDLTFIEGDESLTKEQKDLIDKDGILYDEHHANFLDAVVEAAVNWAQKRDVVVAFPALRLSDRDYFRQEICRFNSGSTEYIMMLNFIYLKLSETTSSITVEKRPLNRGEAVMKAHQVKSQFDILDTPGPQESHDCIVINAELKAAKLQKMAEHCIKWVKQGRTLEDTVDLWKLHRKINGRKSDRPDMWTIPPLVQEWNLASSMPIISEYLNWGRVYSMPVELKMAKSGSSSSIYTVLPTPETGSGGGRRIQRRYTAPVRQGRHSLR